MLSSLRVSPHPSRVLDVESGGLEPPARHLGDEIGGVAQPLEGDPDHLEEELGRIARVRLDELVQVLAMQAEQDDVRLRLDGGRPRLLQTVRAVGYSLRV